MEIHLVTVGHARTPAGPRARMYASNVTSLRSARIPDDARARAVRRFHTFVHTLVHTPVGPTSRAHTPTKHWLRDNSRALRPCAPACAAPCSGTLGGFGAAFGPRLAHSKLRTRLPPDVTFRGKKKRGRAKMASSDSFLLGRGGTKDPDGEEESPKSHLVPREVLAKYRTRRRAAMRAPRWPFQRASYRPIPARHNLNPFSNSFTLAAKINLDRMGLKSILAISSEITRSRTTSGCELALITFN